MNLVIDPYDEYDRLADRSAACDARSALADAWNAAIDRDVDLLFALDEDSLGDYFDILDSMRAVVIEEYAEVGREYGRIGRAILELDRLTGRETVDEEGGWPWTS